MSLTQGGRPKNAREAESGQSTVEFALTLIFMMAFILFFMQLTLVFAFGNLAHYATFMAARAYQSAGPSKDDQSERATRVLVKLLKKSGGQAGVDRFPSVAKGDGEGEVKGGEIGPGEIFEATTRDLSWQEGVRYTFRSRIFLIPLAGLVSKEPLNEVKLTSESWLGREPTSSECESEMARMKGIFDNGC